MMKKRGYTLKIETPCSQNWEAMDTNTAGKYCHQCSKNVIDLTKLSDTEILAIIKRSKGELCGRVTKKQSGRILTPPKAQCDLPVMRKMVAGLLLLSGAGSGIYGQDNSTPTEQVLNKNSEEKKTDPAVLTPDTIKNVFQGIVIDEETREPVGFATILLTGTNIVVLTDPDGKFSLKIPNDQLKDSIHFSIHYITYETKSIAVNKHDLISVQALSLKTNTDIIPLKQSEMTTVGLIITEKPKWWKRKRR